MRFSIIITCHNREKFISRCIRSALNQSSIDRSLYEIIVIDDHSSDGSLKKIREFSNIIKVINNKKNMGLSHSRNIGIKKSRGKYVMMLDSDDYISQHYLHFMGSFLDFNKSWKAVACDYVKINEISNFSKRFYFKKNPIACGILYRRSSILKIGLYNVNFRAMEDEEFRLRYVKKYKIHNVELPLYRYIIHNNNLTKNKKFINKYKKILKKNDN
jgi:glycosyltransferase involved in cell wall biosynthesis